VLVLVVVVVVVLLWSLGAEKRKMKRMFGSAPPKKEPVSFDELSNRIDGRVEQLDVKIMNIETQLRVLRERMKTAKGSALVSTRQQALRLMKQKKMYERQRDQIMGTAFTVTQASFAMESAKDAQDTIDALRAGTEQLRATNRQIRISDIDRVHDELADLMDMTDEISQAMSGGFYQEDMDETELDDELAALGDDLITTDADSAPSYLDAISSNDAAPPQMEAVAVGGGSGCETYTPAVPTNAPAQQDSSAYAFPAIPARP